MNQKVSFLTYLQTLNWGIPLGNGKSISMATEMIWFSLLTTFGLIIMFTWLGSNALPFCCLIALVSCPAIFLHVNLMKRSPSLLSLLPMGRKRKTLFFFLSILCTIVIYLFMIAVISLIFSLLFFLIELIIKGTSIFDAQDTEFVEATASLQGQLLAASLIFCVAGMSLLFSTLEKRSLRRVMTVLIPFLIGIPLKILMEVGKLQRGDLFVAFDQIPLSPVFLCIIAAIGITLTVIGTIRVVKLLKPKNY